MQLNLNTDQKSINYWTTSQDDKFTLISEFDERLCFKILNSEIDKIEHTGNPALGGDSLSFMLKSGQIIVFLDSGAYVTDLEYERNHNGETMLYVWHETLQEVFKLIRYNMHPNDSEEEQLAALKRIQAVHHKLGCFSNAGCELANVFSRLLMDVF